MEKENMNQKAKPTTFQGITEEMAETYKRKNHDYGNSFDQSLDKFGLVAAAVRIGDKINRLDSLITKAAQVKNESIEDTLLDAANYCIMTVMYLRAGKKPNSSNKSTTIEGGTDDE